MTVLEAGERHQELIEELISDVAAYSEDVDKDLLRRAFQTARADSLTATDESSLVERLEEVEVSVVLGSDRNIKITKPGDMDLARLFAKQEAERSAEA